MHRIDGLHREVVCCDGHLPNLLLLVRLRLHARPATYEEGPGTACLPPSMSRRFLCFWLQHETNFNQWLVPRYQRQRFAPQNHFTFYQSQAYAYHNQPNQYNMQNQEPPPGKPFFEVTQRSGILTICSLQRRTSSTVPATRRQQDRRPCFRSRIRTCVRTSA